MSSYPPAMYGLVVMVRETACANAIIQCDWCEREREMRLRETY